MIAEEWLGDGIVNEFARASLGDKRLEKRLSAIAQKLDGNPGESFPNIFHSAAELEGFYRFLRNGSVDGTSVLTPHQNASFERARTMHEVIAIHDTTQFNFSGNRRDLGITNTSRSGFFLHLSLLVAGDGTALPIGVGAARNFTREKIKNNRTRPSQLADENNEGLRWFKGIEEVEQRANLPGQIIHVADRESDSYDVLAACLKSTFRFVIRGRRNRTVVENGKTLHLSRALSDLEAQVWRTIQISTRGKQEGRRSNSFPKREGRPARIAIAARTVHMSPPLANRQGRPSIEMNVVRVWEPEPPKGQEPVEWILWTTENVSTEAAIERVVDLYRARWTIEEMFKALKTGCQFERRQLESLMTLSVASALFIPIAWRMLLARTLARKSNTTPATYAFSELEIEVLESHFGKLSTAAEALEAVAFLGGHLKQNGAPGWITIGRGFEKLATFEAILQRVLQWRCDQS